MTPLQITVDLERNPWTDVNETAKFARVTRVGFAPNLTEHRRPAVVFLIEGADGETYLAHTTWALLRAAARVFGATPAALLMEEENE